MMPGSRGYITTPCQVLLGAVDGQMPPLPEQGISLLDCMEYLPTMSSFLSDYNVLSRSIRATISQRTFTSDYSELSISIHPGQQQLLDEVYENIIVRPSDCEWVEITEWSSGLNIKAKNSFGTRVDIRLPHGINVSKSDVRVFPLNVSLNEFGLLYVALYIVGNYARYFLDRWLADVDRSTPLALGVEELISQAERRMPLLALSEFTRNFLIPE
jgi:hypothetical protein